MIIKSALKTRLARLFPAFLSTLGGAQRLPVLCYHSVNDRPNDECDPMPSSVFEAHIDYLSRQYTIIPLLELAERLRNDEPLPEKAVGISFDDGYIDNHEVAFPILSAYGAHATIFVVSGFINGEVDLIDDANWQALKWEQLRQMQASGLVEIGAHTHSHRILSRLDTDGAVEEVRRSKLEIEAKLGQQVKLFAYPNGQGADIHPAAVEAVRQLGFVGAFSTFWRSTHRPSQRFVINRVMINGDDSIETLELKLSGGYDYIYMLHKTKALLAVLNGRGVWR